MKIYVVRTIQREYGGYWGKGETIEEALKNLKHHKPRKGAKFHLTLWEAKSLDSVGVNDMGANTWHDGDTILYQGGAFI